MNRRTFNDAVTSRVSSLANDIEDVEDDDEKDVQLHRGNIEGEEEDGDEVLLMIYGLYRYISPKFSIFCYSVPSSHYYNFYVTQFTRQSMMNPYDGNTIPCFTVLSPK